MTKPLTGIQRVFLLDAAMGLTAAESARKRGCGEDNVRHALKAARAKLGARNTAHAVGLVLTDGSVDPGDAEWVRSSSTHEDGS